MKKVNGEKKHEHYTISTPDGQLLEVEPEFARMSRRPAIGSQYYEDAKHEIWEYDEVIFKGHPFKPPRFYDKLLEAENPLEMQWVKDRRREAMEAVSKEYSPARLWAKEQVQAARDNLKQRPYEDGK